MLFVFNLIFINATEEYYLFSVTIAISRGGAARTSELKAMNLIVASQNESNRKLFMLISQIVSSHSVVWLACHALAWWSIE